MKLRNKKTGDLGELQPSQKHIAVVVGNGTPEVSIAIYGSLNELNEEWEDYKPTEPLIKDEKIRKAVRLCADIWGADKILVTKSGSRIEFSDGSPNMRYVSFMYAGWQDETEDRTYYAVEELCGEEE